MSGRGDTEDDDREFLAAALKDVTLAARLLMGLSRPRRPAESVSPSAEAVTEFHRGLWNWGCRRWRSRGTAKEAVSGTKTDDVNRASPTTPLSWNGGSGASEGEEQGWARFAPSSSKRPRAEETNGDGGALRLFIPLEPSSAVRSSIAAPNKEVCLPPAAGRSRSAPDNSSPAAIRRAGKKKTLSELRIMEESLLRDRADLEKMLDEQRRILAALREENLKMTKLKESTEEGRRERGLSIDLNCLPDEEN